MSLYRYIDVEEFNVRNPMFHMQSNADLDYTDTHDIGMVGKYSDGVSVMYTGLYRSAFDGVYYLFDNLQVAPNVDTGYVDATDFSYRYASLSLLNFTTYGDGLINGNLTINGNVDVININTLTVEDNFVIANIGSTYIKPDGGFVINRSLGAMVTDTPKLSGTSTDFGTTTTITLDINSNLAANYFTNWAISMGGDIVGEAFVLSSTTDNPPVLTFDTPASGSTTPSTTYSLFNKHFVGHVWDESSKQMINYGFPRQDSSGIIDTAGYGGNGNLADYIDSKVQNSYIEGNLYIGGEIQAEIQMDDNIIAINSGTNDIQEDGGYVVKRDSKNIVSHDTAKIPNAVISVNYSSGSNTIVIINTAIGVNYFKGWVIRYNVNTTEPTTIASSTYLGGAHTLVLERSFSVNLTAGVDTISLFNKRYTGVIWDESTGYNNFVAFPRELGESVIDPVSPINGNIPDYTNIVVNNVTIKGRVNLTNGVIYSSITQIAPTTFTPAVVLQVDIIYLAPTSDTVYILPAITTMPLPANKTKIITFSNISNSQAIIQTNPADNIQGRSQIILRKRYAKMTLMMSDQTPNVWELKG